MHPELAIIDHYKATLHTAFGDLLREHYYQGSLEYNFEAQDNKV